MNPFNNTCLASTKGSYAPFFIEAGQVIFNRTSGSTSPNSTDTATVMVTTTTTAAPVILKSTVTTTVTTTVKTTVTTTVTAKATTIASCLPSCPIRSHSPSPSKGTAIAAGMSSLLGLGLLITLGLLWKQKKQKQSLRKDLQEWDKKYAESMKAKTVKISEAGQQTPYQLEGGTPNLLDDQSHIFPRFEGSQPREIDGAQIYEADNRIRRV